MKKSSLILALTLIWGANAAHARSGTSTASPNFLDKLSISYLNIFEGAAMEHFFNTYKPSEKDGSDSTDPIRMRNYVSALYKLSDTAKFGPVLYFYVRPGETQRTVIMGDSFLKLTTSSLISSGAFNMAADLRLVFPTSESSQDKTLQVAVQSKQISSYPIAGTPWTLGVVTLIGLNSYADALGQADVNLVFVPNIEYKVLPNVALQLGWEGDAAHISGESAMEYHADGTILSPGISWDLTPNVNLNPYLEIHTGARVAWDTTTWNIALSWILQ